jgi:hypothetical protein
MKILFTVMWLLIYTCTAFCCEYYELIVAPVYWASFGSFFTCVYILGLELIDGGWK